MLLGADYILFENMWSRYYTVLVIGKVGDRAADFLEWILSFNLQMSVRQNLIYFSR